MVVAGIGIVALGALCVLGVVLIGISLARRLRRRLPRQQQGTPSPEALAALRDQLAQDHPALRSDQHHPVGRWVREPPAAL